MTNQNQIERRLEALEESMGARNNVPRCQIKIMYYRPGADGKPEFTGERIFEIGSAEGG